MILVVLQNEWLISYKAFTITLFTKRYHFKENFFANTEASPFHNKTFAIVT